MNKEAMKSSKQEKLLFETISPDIKERKKYRLQVLTTNAL